LMVSPSEIRWAVPTAASTASLWGVVKDTLSAAHWVDRMALWKDQ
jgi:hypothetical protein